jgi:hypothetical protein
MSKYEHKVVGSFWAYLVYELPFDLEKLPAEIKQSMVVLEQPIANASAFAHIDFSKRKTTNIKVENRIFEFVKHSFNIDPERQLQPRDKFTYELTEEDEKNVVQFLKLILLNYTDRHIESLEPKDKSRYLSKLNSLKKQISECKTSHECLVIMHNHFNYAMFDIDENKFGHAVPGAQWNLSVPGGKTKPKFVTPESLDPGPTIDNISSDIFQLDWVIGEEVVVTE